MLIKILDADPVFVEQLKASTGATTASKAYLYAAENHQLLRAQVGDLLSEVASLKRQLQVKARVIEQARSAAAALLDKTSQGDMIDA